MKVKAVLALAAVTFKESVRNRIFVSIFSFALFLVALSPLISELTFDEKFRIYFDVSITVAHFFSLIISLLLGCTLISKEITDQTYAFFLVRPISRLDFIIGKILGIVTLIIVANVFWFLVTLFFIGVNNFKELVFIYSLEMVQFVTLTLIGNLFGLLLRSFFAIFVTFTVYLVGNWLPDLMFFAKEYNIEFYTWIVRAMNYVFPHLHDLNFRTSQYLLLPHRFAINYWSLSQVLVIALCSLLLGNYVFKSRDLT